MRRKQPPLRVLFSLDASCFVSVSCAQPHHPPPLILPSRQPCNPLPQRLYTPPAHATLFRLEGRFLLPFSDALPARPSRYRHDPSFPRSFSNIEGRRLPTRSACCRKLQLASSTYDITGMYASFDFRALFPTPILRTAPNSIYRISRRCLVACRSVVLLCAILRIAPTACHLSGAV